MRKLENIWRFIRYNSSVKFLLTLYVVEILLLTITVNYKSLTFWSLFNMTLLNLILFGVDLYLKKKNKKSNH